MPQSTERFRHEDISSVPAGWKVRTVTTSGGHRVRVAFPPGRKVKGSGRLVSILHPLTGANPCGNPCTVRSSNPQELIVMGANPPRRRMETANPSNPGYYSEKIERGSDRVVIWANTDAGPFHVQPFVNVGGPYDATAISERGKYKTLQRARKKAQQWLDESSSRKGHNPRFSGWEHFTKGEKNFLSERLHAPAPKNMEEVAAYKETLRRIDEINARYKRGDFSRDAAIDQQQAAVRRIGAQTNPRRLLSRRSSSNPHELLIMAANPHPLRRRNAISEEPDPRYPGEMRFVEWRRNMLHFINSHWYAGATSAGRTMSDAEYAHIARITHMPPGEYDWSFIRDAEDHEVKEVYEYLKARHPEEGPYKGLSSISTNPRVEVVHGQNPPVEAIHEEFTGQEVKWIDVYDEPHMPAGRYAELGSLIALYVKPVKGGQVLRIGAPENHDDFAEWWDKKPPLLVTDSSARKIYFVNGCQDLSNLLEQFGAVADDGNTFMLGQVRRIDYECRKEHVADPDEDRWKHNHGEEDGELPTLFFDISAKRMTYRGGNYRIEGPWIKN